MNILTVDTEEWFHLLDNESTKNETQWNRYDKRIEGNVGRILDLLESTNTKATFFIVGWIAKKYPKVVKRIAENYQIGSHTMNHQLVWQQSKSQFYSDVESSVKILEDITSKKVTCFRAPGFSIRESEGWAFETLSELGITTDCSVFPAVHAHGGMPNYCGKGPAIIKYNNCEIREFPVTFKTIMGKHIVFSGGGYFRLFPYFFISKWTKESDGYMLGYIHPRDIDPNQPVIGDLSVKRKFKSYVGLRGAERKLRSWLSDFSFVDLETASGQIDWNNANVLNL